MTRGWEWFDRLALVVLGFALLSFAYVWALPQTAPPATWTKSMPADRAMPPTILITRDTPDEAYLCAELPDRQAACRPVYEARKWLRETPKFKK